MTFLEDRDLSDVPSIPEFYAGKTIMITGGSGFMGQTLIEKLLYSCPDLDRIYLLMRPKNGVKSEDRLKDLYSSFCFDRLRKEMPDVYAAKVFAVAGDVTEIGLGLSEEDRALLINRTNIIFHVAANVKFTDTLHGAVAMNLRGTREVVELAKEVRNLAVLVHVSTCYSNTKYDTVEEKIYPPLADWRETIEICENLDTHTVDTLTRKYLNGMPNTYVFTKQLSEHVVYEQRGKMPVVIIRPSIVVASIDEPFRGWINNFNGPVGVIVACGKGIMRSLYSPPEHVHDFIPVDSSVKHFITAAWIRGTKKLEPTDDVAIYNCSTGDLMRVTTGEMCVLGKSVSDVYPVDSALWYPRFACTDSIVYHRINVLLFQLIPAIFVDTLLWLSGKKTLLVKIQRRMHQADIALGYYMHNQWIFNNNNFLSLRSRIKEQDKKQFDYTFENIDKRKYFLDCALAGKLYLLKEKLEDLPKALTNRFRMMVLDYAVKYAFLAYAIWQIWNTTIQNSSYLKLF